MKMLLPGIVRAGSGGNVLPRAAHRLLLAWMLALFVMGGAGVRAGDAVDKAESAAPARVSDPLEPVNRVLFTVNDRLYFWLLKPVARGYNRIVPERGRVWIHNFFRNLAMPVRVVNCGLQGKFRGAGTELARFALNTTLGLAGFGDPARKRFGLRPRAEDFGQTLGVYGLGNGPFLELPILGPSNLRDTVGLVGDFFLDPIHYLSIAAWKKVAVHSYDRLNTTSLHLGEYEQVKEAALDPYVSIRDAYTQHRNREIRK